MTTQSGGTKVESGCYLNTRSLAVICLPAPGALPGGEGDTFARLPWPVVLMAAPLVGGLYILASPVIGFSMVAWGLARRIAAAAGAGARDLAAAMPPAHAVGEAHLTGKPGEGGPVSDPGIEKVGEEIQERRERK